MCYYLFAIDEITYRILIMTSKQLTRRETMEKSKLDKYSVTLQQFEEAMNKEARELGKFSLRICGRCKSYQSKFSFCTRGLWGAKTRFYNIACADFN